MLTDDPVAMLVPLPNDEAGSKAQIGEKDIDEVSELSERAASVTSSIDYSTTSSEENDLEHTKYSVMSLIRSRSTLSGVRPKKWFSFKNEWPQKYADFYKKAGG